MYALDLSDAVVQFFVMFGIVHADAEDFHFLFSRFAEAAWGVRACLSSTSEPILKSRGVVLNASLC